MFEFFLKDRFFCLIQEVKLFKLVNLSSYKAICKQKDLLH